MKPRILMGGLFHETHTFVDGGTRLADFQILHGEEMLACAGDASPLGGALEAASYFGWEVIPTVDMRASPSGMVEDEVLEHWWSLFAAKALAALEAGRVDALYLVLHGAMVTPAYEDVEGELLRRWRALPGAATVPVFGVFDLHANFTAEMAAGSHCLVAYRENPHTDGRAMAVHTAKLLQRSFDTARIPVQHWRHAGIVWPPTGTGTATSPMQELEALARQLEDEHPDIFAINVIAGFSFADTADTGVSFCIATVGPALEAQDALDALCSLAWQLREAGNVRDTPLPMVMEQVVAALQQPRSGPIIVAEPADNIGGGAPGDGTGLMRAFVSHRLQNAAICINDPGAVQLLREWTPGTLGALAIGGRGSRLDEGPLELVVELLSLRDGRFQLLDAQSHLASMCGDAFDMGPCAVVRHEGIAILLTSHKTPPFDLGQWTSQDINPPSLSVIGVKAAVAHRRAYDPIASLMLWADTPGPCRSDVAQMPYRRLSRSVYPLSLHSIPTSTPSQST